RWTGDRDGFDAITLAQDVDAAIGRDRIVRGEHDTRHRLAQVFLLEDGVDAISPQQAVAQLEHDDVGLLLGELGEHGARQRRAYLARGRHDAEVSEYERVARTGILEGKDVAAQGNTRRLECIDDQAAMPHARDDGRGGRGLAGFHAGACERHDGYAVRHELRFRIELAVTNARRHADTLAEIRKIQHAADHAAVEGFALVGIHRVAHTEHAADVEHLQDVAGLHALGHVARIAEQRLAMAECAGNDVALAHLGHASAGQLERVVGGLVGQDLDDHDHTFLGGNVVGGDTHLVTQATGLRHRCNLVDDYRTHLTYLQHGHGTCPSTK